MIASLREGHWCTPGRLRHYPLIMLGVCVAGLLLLLATSDGRMDAARRPLGTDFSQVWTAGIEVREGHPEAPYDPPIHAAKQKALFGADTPFYGWHYPPYFLVVASLLATLPYLPALAVWQATTFVLYLAGILAIVAPAIRPASNGVRLRDVAVAACAFPAVFVNVTHGHNGFLTAALLTAGLLNLRDRPALAGLALGLLAYKPQFAIIVPVALVAQGCWITIATGLATLAVMTVLTTWLFGLGIWQAFEGSFEFTRTVVLEQGNTGWPKIQSMFSAVRMLGGTVDQAYAGQFVLTGTVLAVVALAWHSRLDLRLKAALLLAGSLLTTPYCLDYDLVILGPALAFAVAYGFERGFLGWEKTIFAAGWLMPIGARAIASATKIPLGLIVLLLFFVVILRRAWIECVAPRSRRAAVGSVAASAST